MKFLLILISIYSVQGFAHNTEDGVPQEMACQAGLTVDTINNLVVDLAQQGFNATLERQIRIVESGTLKVKQIQELGQPYEISVAMESVGANGGQIEILLSLSGSARNMITMLVTLDAQYKNAPIKWIRPQTEPVSAPLIQTPEPAPEVAPVIEVAPPPTISEPIVRAPEAPAPIRTPRTMRMHDFTHGRAHELLVPPSPASLSEKDPIIYLTQRNKVGWAVVEGRYFLKTDLDTLFNELQKAVPNEISAHVKIQVRLLKESLVKADSDIKVMPRHLSSFTSAPGTDLLYELMDLGKPYLGIPRHQKDVAVSHQDRRIVIPIAKLQREVRPRRQGKESEAEVAPAAAEAPPVIATPSAPPVVQAPAPVAPPTPPSGQEIQMIMPQGFNHRLYNVVESDLFRHLKRGLRYHVGDSQGQDSVHEQIYNAPQARATYLVRYRLSSVRSGQLIEVLDLSEVNNGQQKVYWRRVAVAYRFDDLTFTYPDGRSLMIAGQKVSQIAVSKQVHAKLMTKHELNDEIIVSVLSQLRQVSPSSTPSLFTGNVGIGRDTYRVGVAVNQGFVSLTTLFKVE